MEYNIAEIFDSVQGEGVWAGVPMTFIRLAGCTVGKPYTAAAREQLGLQVYQERCTDWSGMSFACDTNYRRSAKHTIEQLVARVGKMPRVCLTGGEPLMHDLEPLLTALHNAGKLVHLETSGTIHWKQNCRAWVAVSPKQGWDKQFVLQWADELKILVGSEFNVLGFEREFQPALMGSVVNYGTGRGTHGPPFRISVQPVNGEHINDPDTLRQCLALTRTYTGLALSVQLHKYLGVE